MGILRMNSSKKASGVQMPYREDKRLAMSMFRSNGENILRPDASCLDLLLVAGPEER